MTKKEFTVNFPNVTVEDVKECRPDVKGDYLDAQGNAHNSGGKHLYKLTNGEKTAIVETLNTAAAAKVGAKHDGELWQSDEGRRGAGDGTKKAAMSTAEKTAAAIAAKIKEATVENGVTMTDDQRKRIETAAAAIADVFKEITDAEKTAAAAAAEKTAFVDAWTKKGMTAAAAGEVWDEWTTDSAAAIAQLCAVGMDAAAAAKVLTKQGAKLAKRAAAETPKEPTQDETPKA